MSERAARTCEHFTGMQHNVCKAGIAYGDVRDTSTRPYGLPCFEPELPCAKREYPTPEMIAARKRERDAAFARIEVIRKAIIATGEKISRLPCPACNVGTVRYSVASNGHVWAVCSTPGCAKWLE